MMFKRQKSPGTIVNYFSINLDKDRKNGRTKFLHRLSDNLNQHFKNVDDEI